MTTMQEFWVEMIFILAACLGVREQVKQKVVEEVPYADSIHVDESQEFGSQRRPYGWYI